MGCESAVVCCAEYMIIRKSCQGMVDTNVPPLGFSISSIVWYNIRESNKPCGDVE